jgi:hypothetical protein
MIYCCTGYFRGRTSSRCCNETSRLCRRKCMFWSGNAIPGQGLRNQCHWSVRLYRTWMSSPHWLVLTMEKRSCRHLQCRPRVIRMRAYWTSLLAQWTGDLCGLLGWKLSRSILFVSCSKRCVNCFCRGDHHSTPPLSEAWTAKPLSQ